MTLTESDSNDMFDMMRSNDKLVGEQFPDENCFQRMFWSQQMK